MTSIRQVVSLLRSGEVPIENYLQTQRARVERLKKWKEWEQPSILRTEQSLIRHGEKVLKLYYYPKSI